MTWKIMFLLIFLQNIVLTFFYSTSPPQTWQVYYISFDFLFYKTYDSGFIQSFSIQEDSYLIQWPSRANYFQLIEKEMTF